VLHKLKIIVVKKSITKIVHYVTKIERVIYCVVRMGRGPVIVKALPLSTKFMRGACPPS
jgi:hypothetical protein